MILLLAVYLAGVIGLLCIIDRRAKAAQRVREMQHFRNSTGLLL